MNSLIYRGTLWHGREVPVRHEFLYPVFCFALDLDELPELGRETLLFGYNAPRLLSIRDRDYLDGQPVPLRVRLGRFLLDHGAGGEPRRVVLVTCARYLNYVFNPVSFYFCFDGDGTDDLRCVLAEVNNTFGDRHLYLLADLARTPSGTWTASHPKQFHVSPFNDMRGEYRFEFADIRERLNIRVDLVRDGKTVLLTRLQGVAAPFGTAALAATLLRHPLSAALSIPRIARQAAVLYYRKRMKVYHRPNPEHPMTILTSPPTRAQKLCMRPVLNFFKGLQKGALTIVQPDGQSLQAGAAGGEPSAALRVRDYSFFTRCALHGDVGFGESYTAGEWDAPDLSATLQVFAENLGARDDREMLLSWVGRSFNRLRHALRRNTVAGSRRNIGEHYDLSNNFFRLFLDPTMTYSAALFERPEDTLETAQHNKIRAILRKARIQPGHRVLEIGCGWGALALEAAGGTGCRYTGLTVSRQQFDLATERVRAAGLQDRADIKFCDYRDEGGVYDRIVSVEMLEAVGHEYLEEFFRRCDQLLAPNGLAVLQVITIPDQRYDLYRLSTDWIQKHIFPGGVLPSLSVLAGAMKRASRFVIEDVESLGPHYARTLRTWREAFLAHKEDVLRMGFDESFVRKWEYYFAYCEAGFAARQINVQQIVMTRPGNHDLDRFPDGHRPRGGNL